MKHLTLKNGDSMPILGLGTWKSEEGKVYDAVVHALKVGYRHIDCAHIYGNEEEIGKAFTYCFNEGIVKREEIFVTSKLWNNAHEQSEVENALKTTLKNLQLDYLDLYLIHWPVAQKKAAVFPKEPDDFLSLEDVSLQETWKAMEATVEKGLSKHIGVANFSIDNLKAINKNANIPVEVNQVELHPRLTQESLVKFCEENEILMTAYSPLGSGDRAASMKKDDEPDLFELDSVKEIAESHSKTKAQILISFSINRGISVIPKSTNPGRIEENLEAAEINLKSEELNKLLQENQNYRFVDGSFWTMEGSPYSMEYLWGK